MAYSSVDFEWIRDQVGSSPDDATVNGYQAAGLSRTQAALRILRRRLADARESKASGSLAITGVGSFGTGDPGDLQTQIYELQAIDDAEQGLTAGAGSGRLVRLDRAR